MPVNPSLPDSANSGDLGHIADHNTLVTAIQAIDAGKVDTSTFTESVQDIVGTLLVAGSNITLTYNDAGNTLTIAASGAGGGLTQEQIEDIMDTFITAGAGITKAYTDNGASPGVLTIALDTEYVSDQILGTLVAGTNITLTPNDGSNSITIAASGAGGGLTQEQIEDFIATFITSGSGVTVGPYVDNGAGAGSLPIAIDMEYVRDQMASVLVAGANITITPNDGSDTITIASTGGSAPAGIIHTEWSTGASLTEFPAPTLGQDGDVYLYAAGVGLPAKLIGPRKTTTYTVSNRSSSGTSRTLILGGITSLAPIAVNSRIQVSGINASYDTTNSLVTAVNTSTRTVTYTAGSSFTESSTASGGSLVSVWPVYGEAFTVGAGNTIGKLVIPAYPAASTPSISPGFLIDLSSTLPAGFTQDNEANPWVYSSLKWGATSTSGLSGIKIGFAGEFTGATLQYKIDTLPSEASSYLYGGYGNPGAGVMLRVNNLGAITWHQASTGTQVGQSGGNGSVLAGDIICIHKNGRVFTAEVFSSAYVYRASYRALMIRQSGWEGLSTYPGIMLGSFNTTVGKIGVATDDAGISDTRFYV